MPTKKSRRQRSSKFDDRSAPGPAAPLANVKRQRVVIGIFCKHNPQAAEPDAEDIGTQFKKWLDTLVITSENIGEIRRRCMFPWESGWNAFVRDETARRENKLPEQFTAMHDAL